MLATSRPIEKIAAGKVQRNDDMVLVKRFRWRDSDGMWISIPL